MVFRSKTGKFVGKSEKMRREKLQCVSDPVGKKPRHHPRMSWYQKHTMMMMLCIDLTWVTPCQHKPKHYTNSLEPILKVVKCAKHLCGMCNIELVHKSRNATVQYPTMLHSEQKFAYFWSEWSIVGYRTCAFWDLHLCGTTYEGNDALWADSDGHLGLK